MTAANAWRARRAHHCKPLAEPTLDDILAGSVVRATMAADRVDADALRAMLRAVATRLRRRTHAASRSVTGAPERVFTAGCPAGAEIELV